MTTPLPAVNTPLEIQFYTPLSTGSKLGRVIYLAALCQLADVFNLTPSWTAPTFHILKGIGRWATEQNGARPFTGEETKFSVGLIAKSHHSRIKNLHIRMITAVEESPVDYLTAEASMEALLRRDKFMDTFGRTCGPEIYSESVDAGPDQPGFQNRLCLSAAYENFFERVRHAKPEPRTISAAELHSLLQKANGSARLDPAKRLSFCPRCWVARVQKTKDYRACLDCKGLNQLDEVEAKQATKAAKTFEDYCAKWRAKYERKRLALLRELKQYRYWPDEFDREILLSRGSVCADAVRQFDKDMSRKGNKYRIQ